MSAKQVTVNITPFLTLGVIFLTVAKMAGLNISWWIVLSPWLIPIGVWLVVIFILAGIAIIMGLLSWVFGLFKK